MNGSIEMEIVRLVKEIATNEQELREEEKEANDLACSERWRTTHAMKAKTIKDSLERKMELLRILKS